LSLPTPPAGTDGTITQPRDRIPSWLLCRIAIGLRQQIIQCYT
jgi:hypothetical protein